MTDDFLDTEDNEDESEDSEEEKQGTDDAASGKSNSEASEEQKRIRDLQSKADKAEARANKAEKALKQAKTSSASGDTGGDVPPEVAEWLKNTQSTFREDLFEEDPRFKRFDLDPALIQGETPSEMRESQKALIDFVDKMEGQIRDSVLVEHGFAPAPKASERQTPTNYATMTSEEFAKHEQAALAGGVLKRSGA
jgi:hypothetical protein